MAGPGALKHSVLDFELDCEPNAVERNLLSDSSTFIHDVITWSLGTNVRVSPWSAPDENCAATRVITYTQNIDKAFSPVKQTRCRWVQVKRRDADGSVVLETTSTLYDVPFGDSFAIKNRWRFSSLPDGRCRALYSIETVFYKAILMQGKIDASTAKTALSSSPRLKNIVVTHVARFAGKGDGDAGSPHTSQTDSSSSSETRRQTRATIESEIAAVLLAGSNEGSVASQDTDGELSDSRGGSGRGRILSTPDPHAIDKARHEHRLPLQKRASSREA